MKKIEENLNDFQKSFKTIFREISSKEFYYRREIEAEIVKEEASLSRKSTMGKLTEEMSIQIRENKKSLDKKKEKLEDIKQVSSQIKDLSGDLKDHLFDQRKDIEKIDGEINQVVLNVNAAEQEIITADNVTKGNSKMIFILAGLGILVVTLLIIVIVLLVR